MTYEIRDAKVEDFQEILLLNESLVHYLSPLDHDRLIQLDEKAAVHKVVESDGKLAAFLLCFREGSDYNSPNYIWFNNYYDRFLYVDRIVVDEAFHGKGIGKDLYDFVRSYALENQVNRVTAEINFLPENPGSLAFHKKSGFVEVGQQALDGGKKVVSLQCLDL